MNATELRRFAGSARVTSLSARIPYSLPIDRRLSLAQLSGPRLVPTGRARASLRRVHPVPELSPDLVLGRVPLVGGGPDAVTSPCVVQPFVSARLDRGVSSVLCARR